MALVLIASITFHSTAKANDVIDNNYTEDKQELTVTDFEEQLSFITNPTSITKYTTTAVNIRKEPNTQSEILDTSNVNTSFEVVLEIDGWSMITTEDGYAYMKSDWFVDEPVPEPVNRWDIALTPEEFDLVARIGMLESGNQCDEGQQAVFEVIFNRVYSDTWPDTITDVLSQKRQFSTWKNRNIKAAEPSEQIVNNLNAVLNGETEILPYETVYFSRKGQKGKEVQVVIEDHVFCNE